MEDLVILIFLEKNSIYINSVRHLQRYKTAGEVRKISSNRAQILCMFPTLYIHVYIYVYKSSS